MKISLLTMAALIWAGGLNAQIIDIGNLQSQVAEQQEEISSLRGQVQTLTSQLTNRLQVVTLSPQTVVVPTPVEGARPRTESKAAPTVSYYNGRVGLLAIAGEGGTKVVVDQEPVAREPHADAAPRELTPQDVRGDRLSDKLPSVQYNLAGKSPTANTLINYGSIGTVVMGREAKAKSYLPTLDESFVVPRTSYPSTVTGSTYTTGYRGLHVVPEQGQWQHDEWLRDMQRRAERRGLAREYHSN